MMQQRINEIMQKHNITMYQISEYTGLAYTTVRNNIKQINKYSLDNFLIIAECLAVKSGNSTAAMIDHLLKHNSTYQNAIIREKRRSK